MDKLSKREKTLLYFLCVVVIVGVMVMLVIQPALKRRTELNEQLTAQQDAEDTMRQLIAQTEALKAQAVDFEAGILEEKAHYLPAMNSDDLDKHITGLLQKYGLVAQSLLITKVDLASLETDSEGSTVPTDENIQVFQVDVVAAGTINQFVDLTEAVGGADGLRMAAFDLSPLVTPAPTPSPKPTKTPRSARTPRPTRTPRGMTPTPVPPTPVPTPANPSYTAAVRFYVLEYGQVQEDGSNTAAALQGVETGNTSLSQEADG